MRAADLRAVGRSLSRQDLKTYPRGVTRSRPYVITESHIVGVDNDGSVDLRGCTSLWASGAFLEGEIKTTMLLRTPDGRYMTRTFEGDSTTWNGLFAGREWHHRYVSERQAFEWLRSFDPRSAGRVFPHLV
jgi:hypothetical protein